MSKQKLLTCFWITALAAFCGGCGGFSASKSVSPLDFFLPNLMQHSPSPTPALEGQPPAISPAVAQIS